jgi:hypothetical protein
MMFDLLAFSGRTKRLPYAFAALTIFVAQYALVVGLFATLRRPFVPDARFYVMPLRSLVWLADLPVATLPIALGVTLLFMWALGALSFRRATDASVSAMIAALTMTPIFQIPAILMLCFLPSSAAAPAAADSADRFDMKSAVQGILAGAALTLLAVAIGALVFGTYGFGMFVIAPLVIGATTAFLANRRGDIGGIRTFEAVVVALGLGSVGLVIGALEGFVCILLASPLALGAAWLGSALGRSAALSRKDSASNTFLSIVFLPPFVFASEDAFPANTQFATTETIEIAAQPHDVWLSIVRMDPIRAPLALPFRLGVAYPLGGDITGEGIGATRKGWFSTGVALERVSEWVPDRKITFLVVSDPPAMHEMSPYAHVNAPHVKGYFRTTFMSFEIVPIGSDRCRLIEHTGHELRLDPVLYWMPFARWIIHANNMRVLTHIRDQATETANARP